MTKTRRKKTLVDRAFEFVVVVVILTVLLGLLFPVVGRHSGPHPVARTRGQLQSIITAIRMYEAQYGYLPWATGVDRSFGEANSAEHDLVMELLTCEDINNDGEVTGNKRNIRLLEVHMRNGVPAVVDRWGTSFTLLLDLDYDGRVTFDRRKIEGGVHAYSFGKNGVDDRGEGDDIRSWDW